MILLNQNKMESENINEKGLIDSFIKEHDLDEYLNQIEDHVKKYFSDFIIDKELYDNQLYLTIIVSDMSRKEVLENNRNLFKGWELVRNKYFNNYINITARSA